jgi:hypothetical protein
MKNRMRATGTLTTQKILLESVGVLNIILGGCIIGVVAVFTYQNFWFSLWPPKFGIALLLYQSCHEMQGFCYT